MTTVASTSRETLETAVAAVASSVDGRRFTHRCSIHDLTVRAGGYVSIDGRVGQVHELESAWVEGPEFEAAVPRDTSRLRIAVAAAVLGNLRA